MTNKLIGLAAAVALGLVARRVAGRLVGAWLICVLDAPIGGRPS